MFKQISAHDKNCKAVDSEPIPISQVLARDAGLFAMQWFRSNKNLQTEKKGPTELGEYS
ncbi:MAG: hypothetical protein CM1200mP30_13720 [Pseudomonadota bacterium]|nr:MAG: hypothetical protein CM1200mP30_13720 [Pseudomonadota bacterium]